MTKGRLFSEITAAGDVSIGIMLVFPVFRLRFLDPCPHFLYVYPPINAPNILDLGGNSNENRNPRRSGNDFVYFHCIHKAFPLYFLKSD